MWCISEFYILSSQILLYITNERFFVLSIKDKTFWQRPNHEIHKSVITIIVLPMILYFSKCTVTKNLMTQWYLDLNACDSKVKDQKVTLGYIRFLT